MPDERPPKKILNGELQGGKRSYGGQKKRYKASSKDFNIPTVVEQIAQEQSGLIRSVVLVNTKQKQSARKARAKASPTELSSSDLSCYLQ